MPCECKTAHNNAARSLLLSHVFLEDQRQQENRGSPLALAPKEESYTERQRVPGNSNRNYNMAKYSIISCLLLGPRTNRREKEKSQARALSCNSKNAGFMLVN